MIASEAGVGRGLRGLRVWGSGGWGGFGGGESLLISGLDFGRTYAGTI